MSTQFKWDYAIAEKPLDWINGDVGFFCQDGNKLFVGIIDGAGHGYNANKVAQMSREFLEKNRTQPLANLMAELHQHLRKTIGCVAVIGTLDYDKQKFYYVAIGNIGLQKFGRNAKREITQEGVIGYHIRTPLEKVITLEHGDIIVMYTDGVSSQFKVTDYPELLQENANQIASNIVNKFGKNADDATCIAIRF